MKWTFASHSFRSDTFASGNWTGEGVAAPVVISETMRRAAEPTDTLRCVPGTSTTLRVSGETEDALRRT